MRHLERNFVGVCAANAKARKSMFPFQVHFHLIDTGILEPHFQIPPDNSWLIAAWEGNTPAYSPGFEDSTPGNIFAARVMEKKIASHSAIRSGPEQMEHLVNWYLENDTHSPIGFFLGLR